MLNTLSVAFICTYEVALVVADVKLLLMAICWSFSLVLVLTLTALIAPSQPLFQPPPVAHRMHASVVTSKAAIHHPILVPGVGVERSWNVLVGRRGRFRRLFQDSSQVVCDAQLNCQRQNATKRSETRAILDNYRLPPKHSTHFQSDRMVPSGPNPLHNSNRSQVIFP